MIRTILILTILVSLLIPCSIYANSNSQSLRFSLSPQFEILNGWTMYRLESAVTIPDAPSLTAVKSELEFPLDIPMIGLTATIKGRLSGTNCWHFKAKFMKNVSDPNNAMKDSDWFITSDGLIKTAQKFSYTESESDIDATRLDLTGQVDLLIRGNFSLSGIIGYQYQKLFFNVYGVDGWQLDSTGNKVYFQLYQNQKVGKYQITYHIPYFGLASSMTVASHFLMQTEFSFSPIVKAKDFDDHLLRFKTSRGNCNGKAFLLSGEVVIVLQGSPRVPMWSVKFRGESDFLRTSGTQVQTWYGDDPFSEEDDTGTVSGRIDYDIESNQYRLNVAIIRMFNL